MYIQASPEPSLAMLPLLIMPLALLWWCLPLPCPYDHTPDGHTLPMRCPPHRHAPSLAMLHPLAMPPPVCSIFLCHTIPRGLLGGGNPRIYEGNLQKEFLLPISSAVGNEGNFVHLELANQSVFVFFHCTKVEYSCMNNPQNWAKIAQPKHNCKQSIPCK